MQTATPTPLHRAVRIATTTRWDAALARAVARRIALRYEALTGMAVVESGSDAKLCYVTDGRTCTCQAGANGDPVCLHRALYWHDRGMLDPEPPTPAAPRLRAISNTGMAIERYDASHRAA